MEAASARVARTTRKAMSCARDGSKVLAAASGSLPEAASGTRRQLCPVGGGAPRLSLIHISEPTRLALI
eukprot:13378544-Alexandrium_andersonii.AAC.1